MTHSRETPEIIAAWVIASLLIIGAAAVLFGTFDAPPPSEAHRRVHCPQYHARVRQLTRREDLIPLSANEEEERATEENYLRTWCPPNS